MCGILALLHGEVLNKQTLDSIEACIDRRGPDYSTPLTRHVTDSGIQLFLKSSVLHLRGLTLHKQPVRDDGQNILMFNGQIYAYGGHALSTDTSDTAFLAERLASCDSRIDVVKGISHIDGPFALVYWHAKTHTLFYCRDIFGRKSLCTLKNVETSELLAVSSVATAGRQTTKNHLWSEVDCKSIHCVQLKKGHAHQCFRFDWDIESVYPETSKCPVEQVHSNELCLGNIGKIPLLSLNNDRRGPAIFSQDERDSSIDSLGQRLLEAVSKRIIFSKRSCLICRKNKPAELFHDDYTCAHSKVAVAFSGGIDSTLIALCLDKILKIDETIDLVTVAFKSCSPDRDSVKDAYNELRILSKNRNWRLVLCDTSLNDLRQKREENIKHLILPCNTVIDDSLGCACWFIGRATGRAIDSQTIDADYNLDDILEFSPNTDRSPLSSAMTYDYTSPASMIFLGASIDEQLGGYSSHRSAWLRDGLKGVHDEISFQMRRLPTRNLGRDDRCYSDHGRDVKLPYLDFEFVSYLNQLPIGLKMDLGQPLNSGPKKILRELAKKWGLSMTSQRVKRAMQFGTRIANLEDNREKGNDVCSRLQPDLAVDDETTFII